MKILIKKFANKKAFTMVELLVAMSIFMIFIALSAGSYIGLMKANKLASETQQTYRDVRHVFDVLADEVHNNQIDYTCFNPTNGDPDCVQNTVTPSIIGFTSSDGEFLYRRLYTFVDGKIQVITQKRLPTEISWIPVSPAESLTSNSTKFSNVSFSVFPLKNPYDAENVADATVQWQPSISISITKESKTPGAPTVYKTTLSSRSYGTKSLYQPHIEKQSFGIPGGIKDIKFPF